MLYVFVCPEQELNVKMRQLQEYRLRLAITHHRLARTGEGNAFWPISKPIYVFRWWEYVFRWDCGSVSALQGRLVSLSVRRAQMGIV